MNGNRKQYAAFDHAVSNVIDGLRVGMSGRELERLSGIGHNRMATILRRDTPPPTPGEIEKIAAALGLSASELFAKAERGDYTLAASDPGAEMTDDGTDRDAEEGSD